MEQRPRYERPFAGPERGKLREARFQSLLNSSPKHESAAILVTIRHRQLTCCGYYSPFIEATTSNLCYARSILPGCKGKYLRFERDVLKYWYIASFSLVPLQIAVIITSLLSSSHITYRFGKGLTPKRYRLDIQAMNVLMEEYSR